MLIEPRIRPFEIELIPNFSPSNLAPIRATLPPEMQIGQDALVRYDRTMFALGGVDAKAALLLHVLGPIPKQIRPIHSEFRAQIPKISGFQALKQLKTLTYFMLFVQQKLHIRHIVEDGSIMLPLRRVSN